MGFSLDNSIVKGAICFALLACAQFAHAAKETCVPKADGGWRCGTNVSKADAAPLPKAERTSRPPLLLIDPRRFASSGATTSAAPTPIPDSPSAAIENPKPDNTASSGSSPLQTAPEASAPDQNAFTVQLARAASPSGFAALRRTLSLPESEFRNVQLSDGSWVLLFGNFASIDAARAAIPSGAPGAFARTAASR